MNHLDPAWLQSFVAIADSGALARSYLDLSRRGHVTGKGIPAAAVERAIAMSHEKYCSASIMLGKTAEITTGFDIVEG